MPCASEAYTRLTVCAFLVHKKNITSISPLTIERRFTEKTTSEVCILNLESTSRIRKIPKGFENVSFIEENRRLNLTSLKDRQNKEYLIKMF